MESTARSSGGATSSSYDRGGTLRLGSVGNPFTVKVGQIFTGFGVGCGVGIGIGRPIYLGAIPALQQVLVATRGATDIFSGAGRHLNSSLRKLGVKGIEAGAGCGIGFGHGFGVGLAIKPSAIHHIQSCIGQAVAKIMSNIGMPSGISSIQNAIPPSILSHVDSFDGSRGVVVSSNSNSLQTITKPAETILTENDRSSFSESKNISIGTPRSSEVSATRTEKIIGDFLQNPILTNEETVFTPGVGNLRSEDTILHMLLKHQQIIDKLVEENQKLRNVLIKELKISPSKLQSSSGTYGERECPYADCFECRRRRRSTR